MNDNNQPTRRDWFRLRTPAADHNLGESNHQSVELPPNHDGMDLSQLPPMRESTLESSEVVQLFSDIGKHCSDISLMQRASGARRATVQDSDGDVRRQLQVAQEKFLGGDVPRLQIRYQWNNQSWIDTLTRQEDGFRLVRIAHLLG